MHRREPRILMEGKKAPRKKTTRKKTKKKARRKTAKKASGKDKPPFYCPECEKTFKEWPAGSMPLMWTGSGSMGGVCPKCLPAWKKKQGIQTETEAEKKQGDVVERPVSTRDDIDSLAEQVSELLGHMKKVAEDMQNLNALFRGPTPGWDWGMWMPDISGKGSKSTATFVP